MNEFKLKPSIIYGEDSLDYLKKLKSKKVFIVTDKVMVQLKIVNKVTDIFNSLNIPVVIFDQVEPNPTVETVEKGLKMMIEAEADTIIGFGGGSPIDACKAMLYFQLKFYEALNVNNSKPMFIAIPTTSGTGSEVTSYSVITNNSSKIALSRDEMLPDVAILNPAFTKTLPKPVIADTGIDALTHAIEAYVSNKRSPFTNSMAIEAIELLYKNLLKHYSNVEELSYRMNVQQASCLAGIAFNNSSLGINHSLAHTIGGKFHISHGRSNAIILPYVIYENMKVIPEIYAEISQKVGLPSRSLEEGCAALIIFVKEINKLMGVQNSFKEFGVKESEFLGYIPTMIEDIKKDICTENNPKKLTDKEYEDLLKKVYYGF